MWKYRESPVPAEVYVAVDGEKIVGSIHRMVLNVKVGNFILKSIYGDDARARLTFTRYGTATSF